MVHGDMIQKKFNYDQYVEFKTVICGFTALSRNGLILYNESHLCVQSSKKELDHTDYKFFTIFYNPDGIDYAYDVTPSANNPLLLKPTKERALVECVKHLDWIDEGLLIEGLKSYLDYFWDARIYEVAEHFELDREILDYWLEEARNDCEV